VLGRGTWGYILAVGTLLGVLCLGVALPLFRAGDRPGAPRSSPRSRSRRWRTCWRSGRCGIRCTAAASCRTSAAAVRRRHGAPAARGGVCAAAAGGLPHRRAAGEHPRTLRRGERRRLPRHRSGKIRKRSCRETRANRMRTSSAICRAQYPTWERCSPMKIDPHVFRARFPTAVPRPVQEPLLPGRRMGRPRGARSDPAERGPLPPLRPPRGEDPSLCSGKP